MAMLKANTDCTNSSVDELGQLVNLFDASTLIRESRSYLVDENGTGQTSATNESTLLSTNSDIVSDLEFHKRLVSLPPLTMVMRMGCSGFMTADCSLARP
jgi:hypothetical protein